MLSIPLVYMSLLLSSGYISNCQTFLQSAVLTSERSTMLKMPHTIFKSCSQNDVQSYQCRFWYNIQLIFITFNSSKGCWKSFVNIMKSTVWCNKQHLGLVHTHEQVGTKIKNLYFCTLNLYPIWAILSQTAIISDLGDWSQPDESVSVN